MISDGDLFADLNGADVNDMEVLGSLEIKSQRCIHKMWLGGGGGGQNEIFQKFRGTSNISLLTFQKV